MSRRKPEIVITVNGQEAITTTQAAARYGRELAVMRNLIHRLGISHMAKLDNRTPLYDLVLLDAAVAAMPGSGSNLKASPDRGTTKG